MAARGVMVASIAAKACRRLVGDSRSTARVIFEAKIADKTQGGAMKRILPLTVGIFGCLSFWWRKRPRPRWPLRGFTSARVVRSSR